MLTRVNEESPKKAVERFCKERNIELVRIESRWTPDGPFADSIPSDDPSTVYFAVVEENGNRFKAWFHVTQPESFSSRKEVELVWNDEFLNRNRG